MERERANMDAYLLLTFFTLTASAAAKIGYNEPLV